MGKCKDCKHSNNSDGFNRGYGCREGLYLGDGAVVPEGGFGCMDYEGLDAAIFTSPEFGCVLFEERNG